MPLWLNGCCKGQDLWRSDKAGDLLLSEAVTAVDTYLHQIELRRKIRTVALSKAGRTKCRKNEIHGQRTYVGIFHDGSVCLTPYSPRSYVAGV